MTDYTQSYIFSKDYLHMVGNYLKLKDFLSLTKVSKNVNKALSVLEYLYTRLSALGETVPALLDPSNPKLMVDFSDVFDRIKQKQKIEFSFLEKNHRHLKIPIILNNSLQELEYNHHLLNQYNSEIIHQAILKQPGKTLKLSGITRFIIPNEDKNYFEQLEYLYFSPYNSLKHLHIKNLKNLKTLKCGYNKLTMLSIQDLSKMVKLHCHNNKSLTTLVLHELTALEKLAFCECPSLETLHLEGLSLVNFIYPNNEYFFQKIRDLNIQDASEVIQDLLASTEEKLFFQNFKKTIDYSLPSDQLKPEDPQEENIILRDFTNLRIEEAPQQTPSGIYQPLYQHVQQEATVSCKPATSQNRFSTLDEPAATQYQPLYEKQFLPQRQIVQSSEIIPIENVSKNNPDLQNIRKI